jgi:putative ABC transport system permease protein
MWNLTIKSLLARKLRLALTSLAIVLGVSFIVSSFVVADTLRDSFDGLVDDIQSNIDLTVRTTQEFGNETERPPVDESALATVQGVEGVKAAGGNITAPGTTPVKADGNAVSSGFGPPLLGINYTGIPELDKLIQVEGRLPEGANEFALDVDAWRDNDFVVGQTYTVESPTAGPRPFTLVGTVAFNSEANDTLGAVLVIFDTPTAQEFLGRPGQFDGISVIVDDDGQVTQIQERIQAALPPSLEVVDRTVTTEEQKDDFGQISSTFGTVLLAFAIVTLVVSAFLINNTFQIVIGQRIRELALLRALGGTASQVSRSVLLESLLVGAFSTVVGIGAGVLLSFGLRGLLGATGFSLPSGGVIVAPRTIIAAIVVGIGVTMLASLSPAWRTRRVPPVAALRDDFRLEGTSLRRRITVGGVVTLIGAVLMGWSLFGTLETVPLLIVLSAGALFVFVGVNLLSPTVARPVARTLGVPIERVYGTTGRLSRENAARNPRRTSSTAAALMIGLALVSMSAVVGASLRSTFLNILNNAVIADYFVQPESLGGTTGVPPAYSEELTQQPEIDSVVTYRFVSQGVRVQGRTKDINGTQFSEFPKHLDIDVKEGSLDSLPPNSILVHEDSANDHHLSVGDQIEVLFVDQKTETMTVGAIYGDASILGNWVIDLDTWQRHFSRDSDAFVTAKLKETVTPDQGQAAIDRVTDKYASVKAETKAEFEETMKARIDNFLIVITVFLLFSLLIALIGIANTLALSVIERTRELGLLRAVGMSRRQIRRMVRWEAVIVSIFGALLGVALGILFGIAATNAMPDSFVDTLSIPVGTIILYVVVAGLFGLLAAYFPARRAGKLNVLDAIQHN